MGAVGRALLFCIAFASTASNHIPSPNEFKMCLLNEDQYGECRSFRSCHQVHILIRGGYRPKICAFDGNQPKVCCPPSREEVMELLLSPHFLDDEPKVIPKRLRMPGEAAKRWCNYYKQACSDQISFLTPESPLAMAVGGVPAEENEFPHMAAVGYGDEDNIVWSCGGSLISEHFVLTAAHCLFHARMGQARWVRLGSEVIQDEIRGRRDEAEKGQTHPVIERIRHPEYKWPAKYNDVALLKIGPALEVDALPTVSLTLHPACLQVDEQDINRAVATGWGRLGYGEEVTPDLQKVTLSILHNSECNRSFAAEISSPTLLQRGIDESMICAGELKGGKDTCKGDSGGPLQIANHHGSCIHQIIGIISFGKICGFDNSPAVYTRVIHFLDWIERHVWPES